MFIGFGMKAGVFPMHIWLPEAHPAAPSHISAIMSGVMIKTGIYGIMRLMQAIDTINKSAGKSAVTVASAGSSEVRTRSDYRSPRYTTSWDEIPIVK